ncbi:hypothetical protein QL285_077144 [Trifolium repens]|nr:hypothetical protein QL285_077144 [Trifolium repens]
MLAAAKSNPEFPGASRMVHLQDAGLNHMLHQLPRHQNATCHSLDSNPSSRGRAAATLQNSYASAASHTMLLSPALQTSYNTSEIFRDFSARAISSASRNLQVGGEASHLPPYETSFMCQWNSECGIPHGMPIHPTNPSLINSNSLPSEILQAGVEICTAAHIGGVPYGTPSLPAAPSNSPAGYLSSTSLSEWLAKPMLPPTAISKVGTHRGHEQENIGLSPHTHTLSFKDMHMNHNRK